MEPATFKKVCKVRAKVEELRAIRLTSLSYAVPSRDESPGDYYLVLFSPSGEPWACLMDGVLCKSFEYRSYCTHCAAAENSIERRAKRRQKPRLKPVRKADLDRRSVERLAGLFEAIGEEA